MEHDSMFNITTKNMKDRFPVTDEQPKRINIKEVIRNRGDVNMATRQNIKLLIDRSIRNLPNFK